MRLITVLVSLSLCLFSLAAFADVVDNAPSGYCDSSGCAGGVGGGSQYTTDTHSPSLDGQSRLFQYSGPSWGNSLWWYKLGSDDGASNFVSDFKFYVDSNTAQRAQAFEWDNFQFTGGYNYMMGTECSFGSGVWELWDEYNGHWDFTSIPCHRFSAGSWHHIRIYSTTTHSNHTYTIKQITVDGANYYPNFTRTAKNLGWGSNTGFNVQLDINGSGSTTLKEWIDEYSFSRY